MDDYGRFMRSVIGESLEWRDEIAVDSFLRLEGGQRANAERVLIRQLASVDDWRIPPAIVAGKVEQAVPIMQERLAHAEGKFRITLMTALRGLGVKVDRTRILALALQEQDDEGPLAALISLDRMQPHEIPGGLLEEIEKAALTHPSGGIRCSAAAAMLRITGVSAFAQMEHRPLILSFHKDPETRQQSMAEVKQMIAAAADRRK